MAMERTTAAALRDTKATLTFPMDAKVTCVLFILPNRFTIEVF
jgi:hypothetical protein